MVSEYIHTRLGEEVSALAGHYAPLKEIRLKHNGQEVLYVISGGIADAGSCAGGGSLTCAIVPGYVTAWKNKKNRDGLPVSEVIPISEDSDRRQITRIIQNNEGIYNINFW